MARSEREGTRDFFLRQADVDLLERVKRRAKQNGLSVRDVLVSALKAYDKGKLEARAQE